MKGGKIMGIVDMFTAEDTVDIKISQLIGMVEAKAEAEAENKILKNMLLHNYRGAAMDVFELRSGD